LWDVTTLEGQTIVLGNWAEIIRFSLSVGTLTADIIFRAYKRSSSGVYTIIGTVTLSAQGFSTSIVVYTLPNTSLPAMNFGTGDKLYTDQWGNVTSNSTGSSAATIKALICNNTAHGRTNNYQITTPGYQVNTGGASTKKASGRFVMSVPTAGGGISPNVGLTIGLNTGPPPTPNYQDWSKLIPDMQALGLGTLRFQIDWALIQLNQADAPSAWSWGPLDDAVAQINATGMRIVYPIRGTPTWAQSTPAQQATDEPYFAPDADMMAEFGKQVALRYDGFHGHGKLDGIEIGNEGFNIHFTPLTGAYHGIYNSPYAIYNGIGGIPNAGVNCQPTRDPHFFVQVLKKTSIAIRSVNPLIEIGMCAMWWYNTANFHDFIHGLYLELPNAGQYYDYANFHFYSNGSDPSTDAGSGTTATPSFQTAINQIHLALSQYGDGQAPTTVTR
jgi:hypothetical protein